MTPMDYLTGRINELEALVDRQQKRARQCVEASGVTLTNPSGEPFDELSQVMQALIRSQDTLVRLTNRLTAVHADPRFQSVWTLYVLHGFTYDGPSYSAEYAAAAALVGELEAKPRDS